MVPIRYRCDTRCHRPACRRAAAHQAVLRARLRRVFLRFTEPLGGGVTMTVSGRILRSGVWVGGFAAAVLFAFAASAAAATVTLTQVSSDPYTNSTSQHATEVEPDTFANGATVVAAFQVGRFFDGGSTNIGFARSGDGGSTWSHGFLTG